LISPTPTASRARSARRSTVALDLDGLVSGHDRLLLRDTIAEDRRRQ